MSEKPQDLTQYYPRTGNDLAAPLDENRTEHSDTIKFDNAGDVFERALATPYKWKEKQGQIATLMANLLLSAVDWWRPGATSWFSR